MRDFRVGLIGFGHGGAIFHAPLISTTPGLRLSAIVTSDDGRRSQAAQRYPDALLVDRAEALFDIRPALDLVVVAAPNREHARLAMAALGAGLAVVVDKPFAPSVAEAMRVRDEARRRGLLLTVFHNRRWDGDFLTVSRLVAAGALGDVFRFESRYERWRPVPKQGWRELGDPEQAGGLLFDLGSHLIDQALVLFGPAVEIYAELDRRRPAVTVDDDGFVAIRHRSGTRSHLWVSNVAAREGPRLRVLGSRGAYVKAGLDVQEDALRSGARPGDAEWGAETPDRWGRIGTGNGSEPVPTERGDYPAFYAAVAASLRSGAAPPVTADEAIAVLRVIEAARQSSNARDVVRLERR